MRVHPCRDSGTACLHPPVNLLQVLAALGLAGSAVISYGLALVVRVSPWYDPQVRGHTQGRAMGLNHKRPGRQHSAWCAQRCMPGLRCTVAPACTSYPASPASAGQCVQYLIPMLGMLLGNACSGVAVGLSTILDELSTGQALVETPAGWFPLDLTCTVIDCLSWNCGRRWFEPLVCLLTTAAARLAPNTLCLPDYPHHHTCSSACLLLPVHITMPSSRACPPSGRDRVELLLAMGATRLEAAREVVQRAVRMALTPLLNTMNVVGVVSIPGMMTGQVGAAAGVGRRFLGCHALFGMPRAFWDARAPGASAPAVGSSPDGKPWSLRGIGAAPNTCWWPSLVSERCMQILGGSDPATAARYQIAIMFLIGAATGLSSGAVPASLYPASGLWVDIACVCVCVPRHARMYVQPYGECGKGAMHVGTLWLSCFRGEPPPGRLLVSPRDDLGATKAQEERSGGPAADPPKQPATCCPCLTRPQCHRLSLPAVATIFLAVFSLLDDRHRLRSERLQPRASGAKGALAWLGVQVKQVRRGGRPGRYTWQAGKAEACVAS